MSQLKCILFCEFHPTLGPQITYQAPKDFITKNQMYNIAPYIITKPQFQGRLISLKAYGYNLMGYPVVIENKKYDRNALLFNAVFVFYEHENIQEFEPVVKKLAGYLTTLELESCYLSEEKTKKNLPTILEKILEDVSSKGECTIPVDQCNTIFLKVVKLPKEPPSVFDQQVPVFLWSKSAVESQHWDLTAQHIIPYIDGYNHVQKIASVADVDLGLVRSAIQTLQFYGVIALVPIFLYSNMYAVKPKINNLLKEKLLQEECIKYVSKNEQRLPSFHHIFMLYCSLGAGISVNTLCNRNDPAALGIDEQKLIQYGLIKKFIHKLDKYPVLLSEQYCSQQKKRDCFKWFNGYYNYAEICCKSAATGDIINFEEINSITENEPYVVHIWK